MNIRLDSRAAITCHEYLHKKNAPLAFPGLKPDPIDSVAQEFKEQGGAHELNVIAALLTSVSNVIQINLKMSQKERQVQTAMALLDTEALFILGADIGEHTEIELGARTDKIIGLTQRSSRPDLLVRMGESANGTPTWAPVDIKSHSAITKNKSNKVYVSQTKSILPTGGQEQEGRLDPNDLHQLAHYTRHLQALCLDTEDLWVGIIGRDIDSCVWSRIGEVVIGSGKGQTSFLSDHDISFSQTVEIVRLSMVENSNLSQKSGIVPINSSGKMGCTACTYKSTCLAEMEMFDYGNGHVTLLARVTPTVVGKNMPDIQSIRELREVVPINDAMVAAQIRARVWKTEIPELLNPAEAFDLPEFDIEIDIDLENSMEALRELEIGEPIGRDRLYLYGYGIHDRTIDLDWQSAPIDTFFDYSNTDEGEYEVMFKMWSKLQQEIENAEKVGKTIGVFHYSPHEFSWWKKFAKRFEGKQGVPTLLEVEEFKEKYLVDLYTYAQKISFPTMSYSIKLLAPIAKFNWDVDEAGGANSLLKYKTATDMSLPPSERDEAIAWLDSYNRDDVRATFAVRNYIRGLSL